MTTLIPEQLSYIMLDIACSEKVITAMVTRLLDDPTRCAQSVFAVLQTFGLGYVGVGDRRIQ